jgi:diguanylate cyclase (GGDEF)-like protein/PAS domain S-box-containing protein
VFPDALPIVRNASEIADLNAIFHKIGEAIIIVDGNWRVRYVNDVYFIYSGLSREKVLGKVVFEFAPNFKRSIFYESIERAIQEKRETRKLSFSPVLNQWMRSRAVPYDDGAVVFMRTASEDAVTEHLRAESAITDPVTGLRNKVGMEDAVKELLRKRAPFHMMIIGIEGLKAITDNHGYAVGDLCILELASRLRQPATEGNSLYRIASDEFGAITFGDEDEVLGTSNGIRNQIEAPIVLPSARALLTASIGISSGIRHGEDFETLLKRCSLALTQAKRSRLELRQKSGATRLFEQDLEIAATTRNQLQDDLRSALHGREFELLIQPKVSLATGAVVGGETLLRWNHPARGTLSPGAFLDAAEEIGIMASIDAWVLQNSIKLAKNLELKGFPTVISVNLSVDSLDDPMLPAKLGEFLAIESLSPNLLEIEIPEGTLMRDVNRSMSIMTELKLMGVRLSIDDFGTGYSSFAYLAEFPVNTLKIDRSFILELTRSKAKRTIVKSIITMAHDLYLDVVAEGAEDYGQVALLKKMNCDKIQGYVYAKPLDLQAFIKFTQAAQPQSSPPADAY